MGYYCAWGDAQTMCSSEDESCERRISGIRDKRDDVLDNLGETSIAMAPSTVDDTDRQFWAEDELSNSESRQRLATRRKRRHSLSYRNRTINRNQSRIPYFSISTSDSIHAATLSKSTSSSLPSISL